MKWYILLVVLVSFIYFLTGQFLTNLWVGEYAPKESWMYMVTSVALFFNLCTRWPISFSHALIRLAPLNKVGLIELIGKSILTFILYPYFNIASPIIAIIIVNILYVTKAYYKIMSLEN